MPNERLLSNAGVHVGLSEIVLMAESSPCPHLCRGERGFMLKFLSPSPQTLLVKSGSQCPVSIQLIIFPVEIRIAKIVWYPLVSILCAPRLESTSSFISMVPSWLGVIGTHTRLLFKKSHLWDCNKLKDASGISWIYIANSWKRSLTVKITECGPKSRDLSILAS